MKRLTAVLLCLFLAVAVVSAEVTSITLSKDHLTGNEADRTVTVTVKGTGLKALKSLHVQLSQDGKNLSPVQCRINSTGTEGTAEVTIPEVQNIPNSGVTFTVRAIENYTSISPVTTAIKVSAPATITSIAVDPFVQGDSAISLRLKGRNLDIRGETVIHVIDSDGVEAVECQTVLQPPVQELEEEPSVTTIEWEIGDIVLKDGTIVPIDDYNKRRMGVPTGIIAYERDGDPYMVGVDSIANANNGNGMYWARSYATGYRSVSELCSYSDSDYVNYAEITGFMDGSEAWSILQDFDHDYTTDYEAEEYYPAFWYAETYGESRNLSGTMYETGWFIPSLWELAEIYMNSDIINDSFSEFCNYDLGYRRYRSSSQNPDSSSHSPGINFDDGYIWNTYSTKDESDVYVMVVCPVFGSAGKGPNTIDTLIPAPAGSGIFTIQVTIDGVLQTPNGRIQIAGDPEITRVEMPDVSVDYCGEDIPVIIYGKNFTVAGMDAGKFNVFGAAASQVRIISDTQASVNITYPDRAGTYEVTYVCNESLYTQEFHILNSVQSIWTPGDVILNDGTRVDASDVSRMTATQKANAVAVVAYTKYGLVPYGMGLVQNDNVFLMQEYNKGYNAMISDIIAYRSNSWYADSGVSVTGDNSGYDNWAVIQALDPEGAKNASSQYPGFYWAQNYGNANNLPGQYADGWFIPSLYELIQIYQNRYAINNSLSALGKSNIMTGWFSTSNQDPDDTDYVWRLDFSDGEIDTGYKDSSRYELVVRQFSSSTEGSTTGTTGPSLRR